MRKNAVFAPVMVWASLLAGCFYDVDDGEYEPPEDTDTGNAETGLGVSCEGDEDCAGFEADTCLINSYLTEYYCTILDCTAEQCEGDYQCCDCSGIEGFDATLCLSAEDAGMASSMAGCTCQ